MLWTSGSYTGRQRRSRGNRRFRGRRFRQRRSERRCRCWNVRHPIRVGFVGSCYSGVVDGAVATLAMADAEFARSYRDATSRAAEVPASAPAAGGVAEAVAPSSLGLRAPPPVVEDKAINPELQKHMQQVARTFNDSIQKYLKARTLLDRITKEVDGFKKLDGKGERALAYSLGVRPFAAPRP